MTSLLSYAADLVMSTVMTDKQLYLKSIELTKMSSRSCKITRMKLNKTQLHLELDLVLEAEAQGLHDKFSVGMRYNTLVSSGSSQDFYYEAVARVECKTVIVHDLTLEKMVEFSLPVVRFTVEKVKLENASGTSGLFLQPAIDAKLPELQNLLNKALETQLVDNIRQQFEGVVSKAVLGKLMSSAIQDFFGKSFYQLLLKPGMVVGLAPKGNAITNAIGEKLVEKQDEKVEKATQHFLDKLVCWNSLAMRTKYYFDPEVKFPIV